MVRAVERARRAPILVSEGVYRIELTHGHYAIIDACDLDKVVGVSWFAHLRDKKPFWYASGNVAGKFVRLHRHILGLDASDKRQVDHRNGDQADNRRCNLRIVDNQQNNRNRRTALGVVPYKGVTLATGGRYAAKICVSGRHIYLGSYPDAISAALAYDAAALSHFGEYAATNASLGLLEVTR